MLLLTLLCIAEGFYLPGTEMLDYKEKDLIPLYVDKLSSSLTQIPYRYYYLRYCRPSTETHQKENMGQELSGDTIENSPYQIHMKIGNLCSKLCTVEDNTQETWTTSNG